MSMGFDLQQSKAVLQSNNMDIAVQHLLNNNQQTVKKLF